MQKAGGGAVVQKKKSKTPIIIAVVLFGLFSMAGCSGLALWSVWDKL